MLTSDQINDLHRLYVSERWPIRKIERHLNMGWQTIKKYLDTPARERNARTSGKLDPFKAVITRKCLEKDPRVTAALVTNGSKILATAAATPSCRSTCARSSAARIQAGLRPHGAARR